MPKIITPKISLAQMKAMREGGFRVGEIAEAAGLAYTTAYKWLKDLDAKPIGDERLWRTCDEKKNDLHRRQLMLLYWDMGMSCSEIAPILGLKDEHSVRARMEYLGISRRNRSEAMKLVFERHPEKIPTPPASTPEHMKKMREASAAARRERAKAAA